MPEEEGDEGIRIGPVFVLNWRTLPQSLYAIRCEVRKYKFSHISVGPNSTMSRSYSLQVQI